MPRREKRYHFLYKTTNLLNGKFYVGMHSTDDMNDGYLGSGKRLRYSIRKYGVENFKREVLEFFEDRKMLVEREKHLVNEDLLKEPLCMNLKEGGYGGLINEAHGLKLSAAGAKKTKELFAANPNHNERSKKTSIQKKEQWKNGIFKNTVFGRFEGKSHSSDTKNKMSEVAKKRTGFKNSQFGTCWIFKQDKNKKIKIEELFHWIQLGWTKGRIR